MKNYEKLFLTILLISLLFNIRQCSDSDGFYDEKLLHEYELSEMGKGLDDIRVEIVKLNKLLTKEAKPATSKVVEVKKPVIKKPVVIKEIDSVAVEPKVEVFDSINAE